MITLQELVDLCKASVHVDFNPHKAYYESIEDHLLDEICRNQKNKPSLVVEELGEERTARLFAGDTLVTLQWYPDTPVGSCKVYGQTLEECLSQVERFPISWL